MVERTMATCFSFDCGTLLVTSRDDGRSVMTIDEGGASGVCSSHDGKLAESASKRDSSRSSTLRRAGLERRGARGGKGVELKDDCGADNSLGPVSLVGAHGSVEGHGAIALGSPSLVGSSSS